MSNAAVIARLEAHLRAAFATPFQWGSHDCATFCGAWVEQMTGIDFLAPYRPWTDEAEAIAALGRKGFAALADAVAACREEIPPARAQTGDLAIHRAGVLGIIVASEAFSPGPKGLKPWPLSAAARAFRVL